MTRVNSLGLSLILLIIGVAGFIGTLVVSAFLNRKFYPTLMAIPGLMAVIAIGLMLTGHHVWTVSLLLGLWGHAGHRRANRMVDMDCAYVA